MSIISEGGQSALVVSRGGKIFANGSAKKPIIMTSSQDDGSLDVLNTRGLWGGPLSMGRQLRTLQVAMPEVKAPPENTVVRVRMILTTVDH